MTYRVPLGGVCLIYDRSDPLASDASEAGFNVATCMDVGLSPLVLLVSEGWKPLLARLSDRYGYCWEWVTTDPMPSTETYWRLGEATLTKVG